MAAYLVSNAIPSKKEMKAASALPPMPSAPPLPPALHCVPFRRMVVVVRFVAGPPIAGFVCRTAGCRACCAGAASEVPAGTGEGGAPHMPVCAATVLPSFVLALTRFQVAERNVAAPPVASRRRVGAESQGCTDSEGGEGALEGRTEDAE